MILGVAYHCTAQVGLPPVFAFWLTDTGGQLLLGGVDPDLYTGELQYVPVEREAYWEVGLDQLEVGDNVVVDDSTGGRVVVDTGTSMIMGPTEQVADSSGINSVVLCTSSRSQG